MSLVITDSSNFIIRVVPLCQCAVTLAGYNNNKLKKKKCLHINLVANEYNEFVSQMFKLEFAVRVCTIIIFVNPVVSLMAINLIA